MSNPTINQVIENPELLNHDKCWSFYDWFCKESSLERHAKSFIPKLKFLVKEGILDGDKVYVWFKNSCPMCGTLYNDMRFSVIDKDGSGDFLGGICPKTGHDNEDMACEIWWFIDGELKSELFKNWAVLKRAMKKDICGITTRVKKHYTVK